MIPVKKCLLMALLVLIPAPAFAQQVPVEYKFISKNRAMAAFSSEGKFIILGRGGFEVFEEGSGAPARNGALEFDGDITGVAVKGDSRVVLAGINDKAEGLGSLMDVDTRAIALAIADPESLKIERSKIFEDRMIYDFFINPEDKIVLLSGDADKQYTLSVIDNNLKLEKFAKFGVGGPAGVVVTEDGRYLVLGFDYKQGDSGPTPTLWELTPALELASKESLSDRTKSSAAQDAVMKVFVFKQEIYAAYGWDAELQVMKLQSAHGLWPEPQSLPYDAYMKVLMSRDGIPYVLYPFKDGIHRIMINPLDGQTTVNMIPRPVSSECFPPSQPYEILDVLRDNKGIENIVLTGKPADGAPGCVTIGALKGQ